MYRTAMKSMTLPCLVLGASTLVIGVAGCDTAPGGGGGGGGVVGGGTGATTGTGGRAGTGGGAGGTGGGGTVVAGGSFELGDPVPGAWQSDAATVEQVAEDLIEVGCSRFHSDCNYLCDSIWYECGPNKAKCVEDNVLSRGEDWDHPWVNAELASVCAADIQAAACTEVPPDTPACEHVVVDGCPEDSDGLGPIWTFLNPHRIDALPATPTLYLCDDVEEWLELELQAGQTLRVQATVPEPSSGHVNLRLSLPPPPGDDEPFMLDSPSLRWSGDSGPSELGPVDEGGTYLLSFELWSLPAKEVPLAIEVVAAEASVP